MNARVLIGGLFILLSASAWNAGLHFGALMFGICCLAMYVPDQNLRVRELKIRRSRLVLGLVAVVLAWYVLIPPLFRVGS
jgi:hypothetical protein